MVSRWFFRVRLNQVKLRTELRDARRGLSLQRQAKHAAAIARHLLDSNLFSEKKVIAVYLCNDGEVNLSATIEGLHERGHSLVAPRMKAGGYMAFYELERFVSLETNAWGISEPRATNSVESESLDVALVPLVAFTDAGDRLGRGGGYYDRYFQHCDTFMVGIGHELQRVPTLTPHRWDKSLDAVVTEKGWRLCSGRAKTCLSLNSQAIQS